MLLSVVGHKFRFSCQLGGSVLSRSVRGAKSLSRTCAWRARGHQRRCWSVRRASPSPRVRVSTPVCASQHTARAAGVNGRGGRSRLCAAGSARPPAATASRPHARARSLAQGPALFAGVFGKARGNSGGLVPASYARARRGRARLSSQQRALAHDPRALVLRKRPALRVRPSAGLLGRTRSDYQRPRAPVASTVQAWIHAAHVLAHTASLARRAGTTLDTHAPSTRGAHAHACSQKALRPAGVSAGLLVKSTFCLRSKCLIHRTSG